MELVDQRADADWLRIAVRSEPAPGLRADGDGGGELPLPDAGAAMSRCARNWWSWHGPNRASGIDGCMCCWDEVESM